MFLLGPIVAIVQHPTEISVWRNPTIQLVRKQGQLVLRQKGKTVWEGVPGFWCPLIVDQKRKVFIFGNIEEKLVIVNWSGRVRFSAAVAATNDPRVLLQDGDHLVATSGAVAGSQWLTSESERTEKFFLSTRKVLCVSISSAKRLWISSEMKTGTPVGFLHHKLYTVAPDNLVEFFAKGSSFGLSLHKVSPTTGKVLQKSRTDTTAADFNEAVAFLLGVNPPNAKLIQAGRTIVVSGLLSRPVYFDIKKWP